MMVGDFGVAMWDEYFTGKRHPRWSKFGAFTSSRNAADTLVLPGPVNVKKNANTIMSTT